MGYYVTVKDAGRIGFLKGPFATHEEALSQVPIAKGQARAANSRASFYAFGTALVTDPRFQPAVRFPS